MSTQIDPLTGLPMVLDSIINQIPLGVQTFPFADLDATARPSAPDLYPDSIINTHAFLSGQHPDTGSAQTVATNGDHDLRVHVTNAASGGGAAPVIQPLQFESLFSGSDNNNNLIPVNLPPITAIWGIRYVVLLQMTIDPGHDQGFRFYSWLTKHNDTSKRYYILQGQWFTTATPPDMNKGWIEQEHWFSVGRDPSVFLGVTDGLYDLWCRSQLHNYDFELYLDYV